MIQAKRHGWKLAVLFIDIDQFKGINDTYGHDMGDKVLIMVANRLKSLLREEDTVCRWGGDEFVCLLLEVKQAAGLDQLAEALLGRIAEDYKFNGTVLSVKASIGMDLMIRQSAVGCTQAFTIIVSRNRPPTPVFDSSSSSIP